VVIATASGNSYFVTVTVTDKIVSVTSLVATVTKASNIVPVTLLLLAMANHNVALDMLL
jgi:hypothetical protein